MAAVSALDGRLLLATAGADGRLVETWALERLTATKLRNSNASRVLGKTNGVGDGVFFIVAGRFPGHTIARRR